VKEGAVSSNSGGRRGATGAYRIKLPERTAVIGA
jgi:hypothetical protein